VRLSAKARKAVKTHSLKATATVVATGVDGTSATITRTITFTARKSTPRR
jgi:hypothetical protein